MKHILNFILGLGLLAIMVIKLGQLVFDILLQTPHSNAEFSTTIKLVIEFINILGLGYFSYLLLNKKLD